MANTLTCFMISYIFRILFVLGLAAYIVPVYSIELIFDATDPNSVQKVYKGGCKKIGYGMFEKADCSVICCQSLKMLKSFNMYSRSAGPFECSAAVKEVDDDDLPTSLIRKHRCLLMARGIVEEKWASYRNYVNLMAGNYDERLKNAIFKSGKCGDADSETDDFKRFLKISQCYLNAERKLCQPAKHEFTTTDHQKLHQHYEFCKGMTVVLPTFQPEYFYPLTADAVEKAQPCTDHLHLQAELANSEKFNNTNVTCNDACTLRGDKYKSRKELKLDLKQMEDKLFSGYSKSTREELLKIWNAMSLEKNFVMADQSKGTLDDAVKWMEGLDESTYTRAYCAVFSHIVRYIAEEAVIVYCDNNRADKYSGFKIDPFDLNVIT